MYCHLLLLQYEILIDTSSKMQSLNNVILDGISHFVSIVAAAGKDGVDNSGIDKFGVEVALDSRNNGFTLSSSDNKLPVDSFLFFDLSFLNKLNREDDFLLVSCGLCVSTERLKTGDVSTVGEVLSV